MENTERAGNIREKNPQTTGETRRCQKETSLAVRVIDVGRIYAASKGNSRVTLIVIEMARPSSSSSTFLVGTV